jgi:thiol-disulfide isomerase/thioredoxin
MRTAAIVLIVLAGIALADIGKRPPELSSIDHWYNGDVAESWSADRSVNFDKLKGKVVLVEFWATWCRPCRETTPHLVELYGTLHSKGLEVLSLTAIDDQQTKDDIAKFIRTFSVPYPVAIFSGDDVFEQWGVESLPHAVLIDREGTVRWMGNPKESDLDKTLKDLIGE